MKLYSDLPARRTAQIVGDVVALVVLAGGIWLAVLLHALIATLGDVGRQLEASGTGFTSTMQDIGATLAKVPLVGGAITAPFGAASDAGSTLVEAGRAQQEVVERLATTTGWTVALLTVLLVGVGWLLPRVRAGRRAASLGRFAHGPEGVDVLALRALVAARPAELLRIDADPVGSWRRGDQEVLRRLAELEAARAGIRLR